MTVINVAVNVKYTRYYVLYPVKYVVKKMKSTFAIVLLL